MNKYYVPIPRIMKKCLKCKKEFPAMTTQKFCSSKCRAQFNEKKIRERHFVAVHRIKIDKILGTRCKKCWGKSNEIHHKIYDVPVRKMRANKEMLKEYCKSLVPLCTNCHKKLHN